MRLALHDPEHDVARGQLAGDPTDERGVAGPGERAGVVDVEREPAAGAGEVAVQVVLALAAEAEVQVGGDLGGHAPTVLRWGAWARPGRWW